MKRITGITVHEPVDTGVNTRIYAFSVEGWDAINDLIDWADAWGLSVVRCKDGGMTTPPVGVSVPRALVWCCQDAALVEQARAWVIGRKS